MQQEIIAQNNYLHAYIYTNLYDSPVFRFRLQQGPSALTGFDAPRIG